jgi:hypothetical protein
MDISAARFTPFNPTPHEMSYFYRVRLPGRKQNLLTIFAAAWLGCQEYFFRVNQELKAREMKTQNSRSWNRFVLSLDLDQTLFGGRH